MFKPHFTITPIAVRSLMELEGSRRVMESLPVTGALLSELRESARLTQTHYSTQIEGNLLTQEQVRDVAQGINAPRARKRDEAEVRNYFTALDYVDTLIQSTPDQLGLKMIQIMHGCVEHGKAQATPFRDGQNVIRESGSGNIVYMPPEWRDVPEMMQDLIDWINARLDEQELPAPIVAGIAHYQFATIHPYYDGNGRTARLLTNLILHISGYGLKGIYSLEEYYAKDLAAYYAALSVGESHNYYMGRAEADISNWVEYFCTGMAKAFSQVQAKAEQGADSAIDQTALLRELDQRQKTILTHFRHHRSLTTKEVAEHLGILPRSALNIVKKWEASGFVTKHGAGRSTHFELAVKWMRLL